MTLLARWGYTLLLIFLLPAVFLTALFQRLQPNHPLGAEWLSRFGIGFKRAHRPCVLIHCVSVGEVTAAAPLIKHMLAQDASTDIVISTTTATGANQVRNLFAQSVQHYYLPLDIPWLMARMLNRLKPQKVLIVEVELWPNMLHLCARKRIPALVINARMTPRSAKTYARIGALFQPMLKHLSHVAAQGQRDADQYLRLGLPAQKLTLTQNLKFDLPMSPGSANAEWLRNINPQQRLVLLGGSTHEPEEQVLLDAFSALRDTHADALLVLVPRHPHRFDAVYKLCVEHGLTTLRSSEGKAADRVDVVLVDEMGKLSGLYQLADVAYVGGSLAPRGGHNALEPARFAKPIIMGPSQHNNPEICQQLAAAGALVTVESAAEIAKQSKAWLDDADARQQAGQAGLNVIELNRGAIDATLKVIRRY